MKPTDPDDDLRDQLRDYYRSTSEPAPSFRWTCGNGSQHRTSPSLAVRLGLTSFATVIALAIILWPAPKSPVAVSLPVPAITEAPNISFDPVTLPTDAWLIEAEDTTARREIAVLSREITEFLHR